MERNETMKKIKSALKRRSGKEWSVTGGKGTAWGWLMIQSPPKRRTWKWIQTPDETPPAPGAVYRGLAGVTPGYRVNGSSDDQIKSPAEDPWVNEAKRDGRNLLFTWEVEDPAYEFGHMSPADREELCKLLGLEDRHGVHHQGVSIPAGGDYWQEYLDRAEGRKPTAYGQQYWD